MSRTGRRWVVAATGVAVVVLTACATAGELAHEGGRRRPAAVRHAPAVKVEAAPAAPTTSTPSLPQPQDAPDDPYAPVPVTPIGQIEIPKIGLVHTVYEGIWLTVIDNGPGHWPGSAMPGEWGNSVFAGHRITHDHPFRRIDELAPGDEIVVRTERAAFTYQVTGSDVVSPADTYIVNQSPGRTITLLACHPPGSAQFRYVVHGVLIRAGPPA